MICMSGKEIKAVLVLNGLTINEFCVKAHISIPTFYKIVHGRTVNEKTKERFSKAVQSLKNKALLKIAS